MDTQIHRISAVEKLIEDHQQALKCRQEATDQLAKRLHRVDAAACKKIDFDAGKTELEQKIHALGLTNDKQQTEIQTVQNYIEKYIPIKMHH